MSVLGRARRDGDLAIFLGPYRPTRRDARAGLRYIVPGRDLQVAVSMMANVIGTLRTTQSFGRRAAVAKIVIGADRASRRLRGSRRTGRPALRVLTAHHSSPARSESPWKSRSLRQNADRTRAIQSLVSAPPSGLLGYRL